MTKTERPSPAGVRPPPTERPSIAPSRDIRLTVASAWAPIPGQCSSGVEIAYGGPADSPNGVTFVATIGPPCGAVLSVIRRGLDVRYRASLETDHRVRLVVEFVTLPPDSWHRWPEPIAPGRDEFPWLPLAGAAGLAPCLLLFPSMGLLTFRRRRFSSRPRIAALVAELAETMAARLAVASEDEAARLDCLEGVLLDRVRDQDPATFLRPAPRQPSRRRTKLPQAGIMAGALVA